MPSAAELSAKLSFHDTAFVAGLSKASKLATNFAKNVGNRMKSFITSPLGQIGAAVSGFLSYKAFEAGVNGSIALGDELYKLSRQTSMSVGNLAMLKTMAMENGVEFDQLAPAVGKMQKGLVDAAAGSGLASKALRMLKLNAEELVQLPVGEQLRQVAEKISALENPALRTAMAMKIFGKSGAQLLPMMDDIASYNFEDLSDKANLLEQNAEMFHKVTIAFRKLIGSFKGLFLGIASRIAPTLLELFTVFKPAKMSEWGIAIGAALEKAVKFGKGLFADFGAFVREMWDAIFGGGNLWEGIKSGLVGAFGYALAFLTDGLTGAVNALSSGLGAVFNKLAEIPLFEKMGLGKIGEMLSNSKVDFGGGEMRDAAGKAFERSAAAFSSIGDKISKAIDRVFARAPEQSQPPQAEDKAPWSTTLSNPNNPGGGLNRNVGLLGGRMPSGRLENSTLLSWSDLLGHNRVDTNPLSLNRKAYNSSALLSLAERRSFEDAAVAKGEQRNATAPGAYGAIRNGDAARRKEAAKEAARKHEGQELTNDLLTKIASKLDVLDE